LLDALLRDEFSSWHWLEKWARERPLQRALADESAELTWLALKERAEKLGRQLLHTGLCRQDVVLLFAENSAFLVVALLAIQWAGGVPLLLNPATDVPLLQDAIAQARPKLALVEHEHLLGRLPTDGSVQPVTAAALASCAAVLPVKPRELPSGKDCFALLLTSGSTAAPKVVRVTHARAVLSGYGMGVMCLDHSAGDTIYCVLPLGHATGLMTGLCPALVAGCSLVLRRRFSARDFWRDAALQRATSALYVGEIARRLLAAEPSEHDTSHTIRTLYGNGMPLESWHRIQARFAIPRILEFYGATELALAMVNLAGVPGQMGRIALRAMSPWKIRRLEVGSADLKHDFLGRLEPCADAEPGELVLMGRHRTGDIVVRDSDGYVKHVDRRPGIFRQNGHNVSSKAIEAALRDTAGVAALGVTHVSLPHYDGQAGLLVVVPQRSFELRNLQLAYERLPHHQRPRFVRLTDSLRVNRGLKFDEVGYRTAGVDPECVKDRLYAYGRSGFVPIDSSVWHQLQLGTFHF
jgi:fatty-acyl-CoA synthase